MDDKKPFREMPVSRTIVPVQGFVITPESIKHFKIPTYMTKDERGNDRQLAGFSGKYYIVDTIKGMKEPKNYPIPYPLVSGRTVNTEG